MDEETFSVRNISECSTRKISSLSIGATQWISHQTNAWGTIRKLAAKVCIERPFGRDVHRYQVLREQRFLYRLALGQPI
jgi:hypothetical protein